MVAPKRTKEQIFWAKVVKRGPDECWPWTAHKRWDGYGRFTFQGKAAWAHRFSYELHYGPIPTTMCVLHSCDNPECSNPKHLRLGTRAENTAEMIAKGRFNAAQIGTKNLHAKLTDDQVREIRAAYRRPSFSVSNADELAAKYGVHHNTITQIVSGRRWRHLL